MPPRCQNTCPPEWTEHWREWHRGHGCDKDPAVPKQHWAVSVSRNGENLVTIESNCLAGKPDFSAEDKQCIRDCARNLLAFIGEKE